MELGTAAYVRASALVSLSSPHHSIASRYKPKSFWAATQGLGTLPHEALGSCSGSQPLPSLAFATKDPTEG